MDGDGFVKPQDFGLLLEWLDDDGDGALSRAELFDSHDVVRRPLPMPPDPDSGPAVGSRAPDFELKDASDPAKAVRLSELCGEKPVALVFGSYTAAGLRRDAPLLVDMSRRHQDKVRFVLVYLRESHAIDSYPRTEFELIEDPITDQERIALASRCAAALKLPFLTVVDRLDDRVGKAYRAWPVRMYLIGADRSVLHLVS